MKKRLATKGFFFGLFIGLAIVAYRLFKYSGGASREALPIYFAMILAAGILGAFLGLLFNRK